MQAHMSQLGTKFLGWALWPRVHLTMPISLSVPRANGDTRLMFQLCAAETVLATDSRQRLTLSCVLFPAILGAISAPTISLIHLPVILFSIDMVGTQNKPKNSTWIGARLLQLIVALAATISEITCQVIVSCTPEYKRRNILNKYA